MEGFIKVLIFFGILFVLIIIIFLVICIKDFFIKKDIRADSVKDKEYWKESDRREKLGYRDWENEDGSVDFDEDDVR